MEKIRLREFRKKVKQLMLSLANEIKRGEIDYRTAATHFSASTGLCIYNALRFLNDLMISHEFHKTSKYLDLS